MIVATIALCIINPILAILTTSLNLLVKNTPILILDEATSSLDNETSYNIENTLLNIKDLTTIVITHKLSCDLLSKYDEIIMLKVYMDYLILVLLLKSNILINK